MSGYQNIFKDMDDETSQRLERLARQHGYTSGASPEQSAFMEGAYWAEQNLKAEIVSQVAVELRCHACVAGNHQACTSRRIFRDETCLCKERDHQS